MPTPMTEADAWTLIEAVPAALAANKSPTQVHHNARRDCWLQLEASGKWTAPGPVSTQARDLLDLYLPIQTTPQLVIGQIAQSVDGRIATEQGHSHYITGQDDILRLHRLRALVDAVVVGAGTANADNPRLTVRKVKGANPARVILDPDGRLSPHLAVFVDGSARTIVIRGQSSAVGPSTGIEEIRLPVTASEPPETHRGFAPTEIVEALRMRGLKRLLVEGGGVTVSRFLQAGVLTRLHVAVAPMLLGSGRHSLTLLPISDLARALRPPCSRYQLGNDVLYDFDLT